MIRILKKISFLVCLLPAFQVFASGPYRPRTVNPLLEPWRLTDFPAFDTIQVNCLDKGRDNDFWLGIGNDAVFYDGYQTFHYAVDSSTVLGMIHDSGNELLVSTYKGIYRYHQGKFVRIIKARMAGSRNFIKDEEGHVWIGSDYGLLRISSHLVACLNPAGLFEISGSGEILKTIWKSGATATVPSHVASFSFPVYTISYSLGNTCWMAITSPEGNLAGVNLARSCRQPAEWKFLRSPELSPEQISGVSEKEGYLYVACVDPNIRLQRCNLSSETWDFVDLKALGGDDVHSSMKQTSDGTLWIGGHSKLYALNDQGWRVYQYPEVKLPLAYITLYVVPDNFLYVVGANGSLMCYDTGNSRFSTYEGLNFQCNSPDGSYWFTTGNGELVKADQSLRRFIKYGPSDGLMDRAMVACQTKNQGLWVGGSHHGKAAVAHFTGEKWELTELPQLYLGVGYNGICELSDSSLVFAANGVLELENSSYRGGFVEYKYRTRTWEWHSRNEVPQRISSISQTPDGKLWFSGGGVVSFDGRSSSFIQMPGSSTAWIDDVKCSASGQIWVAQGGAGVVHFDGERWKRYTTFDGLISNMATNLLVVNDSNVYVATDKGISFFDGRQFKSHVLDPAMVIQRERGLLRQSVDGTLWINQGTREWYLYDFKNSPELTDEFRTIACRRETNPPKTFISCSDREVSPDGNVIITYHGVDFMNQTPEKDLEFSYRLNGGAWSAFSNQKSTVLLDLPDGDYTFEVRARDLDLNVEPLPASLRFTVLPPVYKRAWFILTILFFLAIIGGLLKRLYNRNRQIHELDQLKLRLFTDISHELRTPLTLILLPLQKLMQKTGEKSEARENLELIQSNVQRLQSLVDQVVDMRRIEAGKLTIEAVPGDIIRHIRSIFQYYEPLSKEKAIRFSLVCDEHEYWVMYDPDKFEKIVMNLLSNAFKYTPVNETIQLVFKVDEPAGAIRLWVNDTGPGIPPELQPNIFDRFYRLRTDRNVRIPGSGIGLSLVKELVGLFNGSVWVVSDGKRGSSFEVVLPLIKAEKLAADETEKAAGLQFNSTGDEETPQVLLVEDEEQLLAFVARELSERFRVTSCCSAEKAIDLLKDELPDLIISDVMLPGMPGTLFCRQVKEQAHTSHLPVILLTARDSSDDILDGLASGADDYLVKPFKMVELIARCSNLIENRKRLQQRFAEQELLDSVHFASHPADQDFLDKAFSFVTKNIDNPELDVSCFCQEMGVSKTLLYSKLKALTGLSAIEFIRNIRLKEARKLLVDPENKLTIAEISYRVGFNDPLYFSRCFKKYFGVPPSEI